MKLFLYNTIRIGIVLLLLTLLLEILLFLRPNTYSYKRMYVEEHLDDITCLLLGDSHIEEALNPSLMGKGVFNMAISGRALVYDVELAKRYVPMMSQVRHIIIPLDHGFFYYGRENRDNMKQYSSGLEDTYKCMYYKYMGIHIDGFWYWSEFLNSKLDYMARFLKNDAAARECDSLGYIKLDLSNRGLNWEKKGLPMAINAALPAKYKERDRLYSYFSTLAELANNQGARLILLVTPRYKTYNSLIDPLLINEMKSFVSDIKEAYTNVEYYDYSSDSRFMENDFNDSNHLSDIGSIKFSKIIKNEVLNTY